ncbi:MAG: hypothetical protein ACP5R5_14300, partial [Armatimonadota bacterium]
MSQFRRYSLLVIAGLLLGSNMCWDAPAATAKEEVVRIAVEKPSAPNLQKLNAVVSRETVVNALLRDPGAKAALVQEALKLGHTEEEVNLAAGTPLRVKGDLTRVPVTDPNESAYAAVNWHAGLTFTPNNLPVYGPANYRLGHLIAYPCECSTLAGNPDYLKLRFPQQTDQAIDYGYTIRLYLELPAEPAVYVLALRVVRPDGKCRPGWLARKDNWSRAAMQCWLGNGYPGGAMALYIV